ncbi:nuclear transport factor 2 family protein [Catellatospora sp. NPDC049609]|uniref:nuclear transport factor 2 family protein n=1 Tax=Catellatospora sp. NPDC049609 TaxID=3155505 RepID=UPI00341A5EBA
MDLVRWNADRSRRTWRAGPHADDFVLVNPGGGEWDKGFYLGGIADGSIDYRRFEAVTPIQVLADEGLAVVRYRSAIEIAVDGGPYVSLNAWHLDCYRHDERSGWWRCVWPQATRTDDEAVRRFGATIRGGRPSPVAEEWIRLQMVTSCGSLCALGRPARRLRSHRPIGWDQAMIG